MWPFEDTWRNQDPVSKYREWLRKWLFRGNRLNTLAVAGLLLSVTLASAYGLYTWHNQQVTGPAVSDRNISEPKEAGQAEPVSRQNNSQPAADSRTAARATVNPEEMVKPVMGHVLTGVGMTYSEVFKDYRYSTGVSRAAEPGAQVKAPLPGTVSLVASGEKGTW